MDARLNIVTLGVRDLGKAREFYEKGLGFEVSRASQGNIVFLKLGALILALYPWELLAEDANQKPSGNGFRGVTLAHNVENKEQVAEILAQAEAAGAQIVKRAQDVFWGGHSGYFADPDGHLWEVAWNPFFAFNERDELQLP